MVRVGRQCSPGRGGIVGGDGVVDRSREIELKVADMDALRHGEARGSLSECECSV